VAGSRRSLAKWDSLRRDQNAKVFTNLSPDVMPYFYNSVDCLLNPIDAAGMSLTSLEAMACGLPVIMVRGDRYPLEDERTGLLVNPEPEAISRAIQRLWEDPSLRRRLGQHARERVLAEFSTASVLPRLARLYAG
jgi:glycosyltransferase involved in cell wall biosynthesis